MASAQTIFRHPREADVRRLLAVDPATRGRGVRRLYLLTTTAAEFFSHLGYKTLARDAAPPSIRATSEFSALCPASSVLMVKEV